MISAFGEGLQEVSTSMSGRRRTIPRASAFPVRCGEDAARMSLINKMLQDLEAAGRTTGIVPCRTT